MKQALSEHRMVYLTLGIVLAIVLGLPLVFWHSVRLSHDGIEHTLHIRRQIRTVSELGRAYVYHMRNVMIGKGTRDQVDSHMVSVADALTALAALTAGEAEQSALVERLKTVFLEQYPQKILAIVDSKLELQTKLDLASPLISDYVEASSNLLDDLDNHELVKLALREDRGQRVAWLATAVSLLSSTGLMVAFLWLALQRSRALRLAHEAAAMAKAAQAKAELASTGKSRFVAYLSHEFRTPLTAICGFADLIVADQGQVSAAELSHYATVIQRNGQGLLTLVNQALDMAKIEAGKVVVELSDFSPAKMLASLRETLGKLAKDKQLELTTEITANMPDALHGDAAKIMQIMLNLVGNAIKFSESGTVKISASWSSENTPRQGVLHLAVSDSGRGIDPAARHLLFQPFEQIGGSPNTALGTGLGLALSLDLCRVLGGDLVVADAAPGQGATFIARLPLKQAEVLSTPEQKTPSPAPMAWSGDLSGVRVLLAEDAPDNQLLIATVLRSAGSAVDIVDNGFDALAMGGAGSYDVILMDIQLPGINGYQVVEQLRKKNYRGPILALTASPTAEARLSALRAGCTEHMPKPIEFGRLLDWMARQISPVGPRHAAGGG